MKTLLCLTDFSASADNAVRYAHELAQRMNSRMTLFHSKAVPVCPALVTGGGEAAESYFDSTVLARLVQEKLQANLDQLENLEWGLLVFAWDEEVPKGDGVRKRIGVKTVDPNGNSFTCFLDSPEDLVRPVLWGAKDKKVFVAYTKAVGDYFSVVFKSFQVM